jgi:hypothetical protein
MFCLHCELWDNLTPDVQASCDRFSIRFECTAYHTEFTHPTQKRRKHSSLLSFHCNAEQHESASESSDLEDCSDTDKDSNRDEDTTADIEAED